MCVNAHGVLPLLVGPLDVDDLLPSQNLEMKVLSKRDNTSGVKKIKLIDELRPEGSYNFPG